MPTIFFKFNHDVIVCLKIVHWSNLNLKCSGWSHCCTGTKALYILGLRYCFSKADHKPHRGQSCVDRPLFPSRAFVTCSTSARAEKRALILRGNKSLTTRDYTGAWLGGFNIANETMLRPPTVGLLLLLLLLLLILISKAP